MMSKAQIFNLKGTYCEFCDGSSFVEHESGFYVCSECGVQTKINHSVMLQYNDIDLKGPKMKCKLKLEDEDLMYETTFASGLGGGTSNPSELSESEGYNRKSSTGIAKLAIMKDLIKRFQDSFLKTFTLDLYLMEEAKRKSESLFQGTRPLHSLDAIVKYFLSLRKSRKSAAPAQHLKLQNDYLNNNIDILNGYESPDEYLNMKKCRPTLNDILQKSDNFRKLSDIKQELIVDSTLTQSFNIMFNFLKICWLELLKDEIDFSIKKNKQPVSRQFRRPKIRSRRNTEEDTEKAAKKLRRSIIDKCREYNLNHKSILELEDYKNSRLPNKLKYEKFIEEYDQVRKVLKLKKEAVTSKIIFALGRHFKLDCNYNDSLEEMVHKIFIGKELNYVNLYSEPPSNDHNSLLNADQMIALKYIVLNSSILHSSGDSDLSYFGIVGRGYRPESLLFCEISDNFKSFDILEYNRAQSQGNFNHKQSNFNSSNPSGMLGIFDLKLMKYINKEKLMITVEKLKSKYNEILKNISGIGSNYNLPMFNTNSIPKICNLIGLPFFIELFSTKTFNLLEPFIVKHVNQNLTLETLQLSVIFYSIKLMYGLNEMPYLVYLLSPQYQRWIYSEENSILKSALKTLEQFANRDKLYLLFSSLPPLPSIFENLVKYIKHKQKSTLLWDKFDFKRRISQDYKSKFIAFNKEILFEDKSSHNGVSKKLRNIIDLKNKSYKKWNVSQVNNVSSVTVEVLIADSSNLATSNKLSRVEHIIGSRQRCSNLFSQFASEEIEFYTTLKAKETSCLSKVVIPFPCDTQTLTKTKAYKYEVSMHDSEMLLLILFKQIFKVDFSAIRAGLKVIEGIIKQKFN